MIGVCIAARIGYRHALAAAHEPSYTSTLVLLLQACDDIDCNTLYSHGQISCMVVWTLRIAPWAMPGCVASHWRVEAGVQWPCDIVLPPSSPCTLCQGHHQHSYRLTQAGDCACGCAGCASLAVSPGPVKRLLERAGAGQVYVQGLSCFSNP
jgi:hypothetical protein